MPSGRRNSGHGRDAWTERLKAEHDNLRAALSWSISDERAELAWRLAGALFWYWYYGGYWSEGRAWLERALGAAPETVSSSGAPTSEAWIKALHSAGAMACVQGDYAAASPRLEKSAQLRRKLGESSGLAYTLLFLSIATMGRGEVERVRALAEESVALFRDTDDAFGLAAALSALGVVLGARGEYGTARSALEDSAGIARRARADWLLALPLRSLGVVTLKQVDPDRAEAYLKEPPPVGSPFGRRVLRSPGPGSPGDYRRGTRRPLEGGAPLRGSRGPAGGHGLLDTPLRCSRTRARDGRRARGSRGGRLRRSVGRGQSHNA